MALALVGRFSPLVFVLFCFGMLCSALRFFLFFRWLVLLCALLFLSGSCGFLRMPWTYR